MNTKQKTKLSMYISVRDYLLKYLTILNVLPKFQLFFTALQNAIIQIQDSGEQQGVDKSGNTEGLKIAKKALIPIMADNARKLFAFAKLTKNYVLMREVSISESDMKHMDHTELRNTAQVIYGRAQTNLADLTTYGITEATQTAYQMAITNFNDSKSKPRLGTTETSLATQQLLEHFKNGDDALNDLDTVIEIVRLSQPNFYIGYNSVRKLMKSGGVSLSIKGMVTDMISGKGLKGAKLTFTMEGAEKTSILKKSAQKGGIAIRNATQGTYSVIVELPGYKTKTITISVVSGQLSKFKVALEKA